jgi:methylated-DNA-[protein]-cysteine S-methyltransferase
VVGTFLPEPNAAPRRAGLTRKFPGATEQPPPPAVARAIEAIRALLDSGKTDLADIPLDLSGVDDFERRAYEVAREIKPGSTLTYGEIAARLGEPGAARAVGAAMGRNPVPIIVPCHRVLAAGGGFGGFSAPGGLETKAAMLAIEGARTSSAPLLFDDLPIALRPNGSP